MLMNRASKQNSPFLKKKCEKHFFSTNTKESKQELNLCIGGTIAKQTENPNLLGVAYDRQLSFKTHVRYVTKKVVNRSRVLYTIAGTDWEYDKTIMRRTYIAAEGTFIQNAGPASQPWISKANMEELEKGQKFDARAITGQLETSPVQ